MKTLLEVKNEWVKTQVGYGFDKEDGQFSNWNEWWGHRSISEQDLDEISKMYAEQFIDASAKSIYPFENGEKRKVMCNSILKLKDQLK